MPCFGFHSYRFHINLDSDVQNNMTPQKYKQETGNQPANQNKDENNENSKESVTGSLGFNSGRSRRTRTPMVIFYEYQVRLAACTSFVKKCCRRNINSSSKQFIKYKCQLMQSKYS